MKASLALTFALLAGTAQLAWADDTPTPPATPPLQCACTFGGPVA